MEKMKFTPESGAIDHFNKEARRGNQSCVRVRIITPMEMINLTIRSLENELDLGIARGIMRWLGQALEFTKPPLCSACPKEVLVADPYHVGAFCVMIPGATETPSALMVGVLCRSCAALEPTAVAAAINVNMYGQPPCEVVEVIEG